MDTDALHLIAGILIMMIGVAAIASPVYRNFKEKDPKVDHLKMRHMMIGILTVVLGGMVAANRIQEILEYGKRFVAMIATLGA